MEAGKGVVFRSKLPDIDIPDHLPLHSYCFERLPEVGERPCLIDGATGEVMTYADVDGASRRLAAGLHRRAGIRKGDVVMLLLPNSFEFVLAFLAASRLGAVATAANPLHLPAEIAKHAEAAGAKLLLTQSLNFDKVSALRPKTAVVRVDEPGEFAGFMAECGEPVNSVDVRLKYKKKRLIVH